MAKLEDFASLLEEEYDAARKVRYPNLPRESVTIVPGPKYTKVDVGSSGKYMVVNATGEIFGIKGYGVIHRGHQYGTLDTIHDWDWSGYVARRRST